MVNMMGRIFGTAWELLRIRPYPDVPIDGYWGQPSATIDWCEENYVVSYYFAEWSNTVSNSIFFVLSFYLLYSGIRHNLESRFILTSLGFGLVGFGSWLFHMSLQYKYQLLDELPMLYVTCIPAWSVLCEQEKKGSDAMTNASKKKQWIIATVISVTAVVVTALYMGVLTDPSFHEVIYAILTMFVVFKSAYLSRKHVKGSSEKKNLRNCMLLGVLLFLIAYVMWQLDVHRCDLWIGIRRHLMLPFGTLLELHAWWHLLTGLGVYYFIVSLIYLRLVLHSKQDNYVMIWRWKMLPEVVHNKNALWKNYSYEFLGPYNSSPQRLKTSHVE
ncbi:HDR083Cp [Eremothecium sinecaudum]|uniref:HDR083Cp n=1 Tax=Eremothecium sinecaudum TaxID=45286 RepID=A0A0X8HSW5_9SACH|nr:HDR083Cp [Eremothecium sinecaudum]AMD20825.1 HDR083Cp [Eremothecium sinecaudum]